MKLYLDGFHMENLGFVSSATAYETTPSHFSCRISPFAQAQSLAATPKLRCEHHDRIPLGPSFLTSPLAHP